METWFGDDVGRVRELFKTTIGGDIHLSAWHSAAAVLKGVGIDNEHIILME